MTGVTSHTYVDFLVTVSAQQQQQSPAPAEQNSNELLQTNSVSLGVSEGYIDNGPLSDTELAILGTTVVASGMAIAVALSRRSDDEDDEM
ncbi:hypothetical protein IJG89_00730 [Candidatus Saccharibacteria bacterium]|nr:hypothetical protein [Candidatus Saccharibacteria bacterium]